MSFIALDTDILMYKATQAVEEEIEWEPDIWTLYMDLNRAKDHFIAQVDRIKARLNVDEVVYCVTDYEENFRKQLDKDYKSNRRGTRKPVGYKALLDWVREEMKGVIRPRCEADDSLGILATTPENIGNCIIVSDDKDLKTIPGQLYRPSNDELMTITQEDADYFFYTQTLTGDATDNIPGLKGVGPKTAEKLLGNRPHWGAVEQAFIKAGQTKEDAIHQARLVRILRHEDWDYEKGEPKLWMPKT